jgi:hypothetical protein
VLSNPELCYLDNINLTTDIIKAWINDKKQKKKAVNLLNGLTGSVKSDKSQNVTSRIREDLLLANSLIFLLEPP